MTPKEIAKSIINGNIHAKDELEKMFGKKFADMTIEERRMGCAVLSAFYGKW